MTKRKNDPYRGGWMNFRITGGAPVPAWLSDEQRRELLAKAAEAEAAARLDLLKLIANIREEAGHFGSREAALKDEGTQRVAWVVLKRLAVWRFDKQRRDTEPEPAEWEGLIRKIKVPERPTQMEALALDRSVNQHLPLLVLAELDGALLRAADIGRAELFDRLIDNPTAEDAALLRDTLTALADALTRVRGRTGNKADVGPHLRAVCAALQSHCSFSLPAARPVAAELLNAVGIRAPRGKTQLIKHIPD